MKSLIVFYSFHHNNTEKIANIIAKVLQAETKKPQEVEPKEIQEYDLVGFGSGIYGEKHHEEILDFADKLSQVTNRKAFIFMKFNLFILIYKIYFLYFVIENACSFWPLK